MTPVDDLTSARVSLNDPSNSAAATPIPVARPDLPPLVEFTDAMANIWNTQMLSNFGPVSRQLESMAEDYLGVAHVRATASGDIGMMAVIAALDLAPGAPCFLSTYTFNSTINTAIWNRLRPVFVDIDVDTYNMSPAALARAVGSETEPGLILATHVFGAPCDVEALTDIAGDRHRLVFDAAHGLGSMHGGVPVGNFGDAEMFSLSGTKPVTSGEGGLISTRHDWLVDRLERLRGYGFRGDYRSDLVGLNGKMSEIHAALGVLNFGRIDEILARRDQHVAQYRSRLGDSVGWQRVLNGDRSTHKDLVINVGSHRAAVEESLTRASIQTKRYFVPLHFMPAYSKYITGPLTAAEQAFDESLCIPLFSDLTTDQIDRVCDVIGTIVG